MTKEELIQFEDQIAELFLAGKIRAPVHLSRGNEEQLIEIFKGVKPEDYVFSTHRSHYHALLKGVPIERVRDEIISGRSMHLYFKEYNFFTSAMVGGICPIALGVAMAIKRKNSTNWVWVFVGDMTAETGIFHECTKYASNFNLPIWFCIEDNSYSTNTPTRDIWGIKGNRPPESEIKVISEWEDGGILYYRYTRGFPHVGVGKWVTF